MGALVEISGEEIDLSIDSRTYNEKKMIPVAQIDKDGNVVAFYLSIAAAERATGIRHIYECVGNKPHRKTAGGYRWVIQGENYDRS